MRKIPKWLIVLLGILAVTHPEIAKQLGTVVEAIQSPVDYSTENTVEP